MSAKRESLVEQGLVALNVNWDFILALVLFFASFALYARTAAPGVLDADYGEFQTNIYRLGVSHTGYPLYFLLAKFWTWLIPVGSIAYRANVFSGLFGALTLVLIYLTLRTLNLSLLVSFFTSVLFGVSRVQWSQAVIPDVYTLNSFFIVLVLWLAILWRMGRVPLWWLALAFGFSLTHHRTMVWLAPALLIFVLWSDAATRRRIFQPRELLKTIAALFLPLLLYLYIPLRGSSDVGVEYHASNFNEMILASNVSVWLRFGPPGFLWERITQVYLPLLVEQFTVIGFAMGWLGIFALATKRVPKDFPASLPPRQLLLLLGLAHLAETAFAIVFWVVDSEIFFIPSYLTFLFFIAIGFQCAMDWAEEMLRRTFRPEFARRAISIFAAILFLALCGYLLVTNFPRNDLSNNDQVEARWREILAQPLEENATIVGPWEDLTPLEYFQYVENVRTDLKRRKVVIFKDQLKLVSQGDVADELRQDLSKGVYLTRHPADTETLTALERFSLIPFATLWRVNARAKDSNNIRAFQPDDELQSIGTSSAEPQAGNFFNVNLEWSRDAPLEKMRLRWQLRDASNTLWDEYETLPRGGRNLTRVDKFLVNDPQGIFIPPDAPPGEYTLELAAFERDSQNPLPIVGDSNVTTLALDVQAPQKATARARVEIPRVLETAVGDAKFLGYTVSNEEPRGGDVLEFSSWWQNIARADDALEIKMRDANDVETVLYQGALFPNARGEWNPAQIVRARQEIVIPPQAAAGVARLFLSLNGQALPPIRVPLGASQRNFRVPIIQRPQLTLVGDSLQLLGYKLDRNQYRAGETIPLTLYWSANQTPRTSYKVFVHLVDANGVLRAQRDSIPQNGGLPTNRWFPGEYITDEYTLQLPNDLAPGDYHILVGMYEEANGERVPLMDANRTPISNNAVMLDAGIQIR